MLVSPPMAYVVKDVSEKSFRRNLQSLHDVDVEEFVRYPPESDDGERVISLALLPLHQNHHGFWVDFKTFFGHHPPDYQVLLQQKTAQSSPHRTFVLYEGRTLEESKEAYQLLYQSLLPFMRHEEVDFSEMLLEVAVLPSPKLPRDLAYHLVEVMETQPDARWSLVYEALVHHACFVGDKQQVETLLTRETDLQKASLTGNSILHIAAASHVSRRFMEWLLDRVDKKEHGIVLKKCNSLGKNAFEIAFEKSNASAMKAMIGQMGIALGAPGDSTLLHRAAEHDLSDSIWAFVEETGESSFSYNRHRQLPLQQLSLDSLDNHGDTPLMLAAKRGYVNSCLSLLLGGARANFPHRDTGETALHYAAEHGSLLVVMLLCVFGGDTRIKDRLGETPIDKARLCSLEDGPRCVAALEEIAELQEKAAKFLKSTTLGSLPVVKPGSTFLCSMDGGGTRSFNSAIALLEIENRMKQIQPDCKPAFSCFDYLAGTSAGALAALLLGHCGASTHAAIALNVRFMLEIFSKPKQKRGETTEELLKEAFGDDIRMADVSSPRLILVTTLADRNPSVVHLITNYGKPRDGQKGPDERLTWEAAFASMAAPYYFPSFDNKFLDGGLMANNPTAVAMTEVYDQAEREGKVVTLGCVLSLGNGIAPTQPVDNIEFFIPNPLKMVFNMKDTVSGLTSLLDHFITQVTNSDGPQAEATRAWCKSLEVPYFRFSPPLAEDISPATTDMNVIIKMMFNTKKYMLKNSDKVDQAAKLLLAKQNIPQIV